MISGESVVSSTRDDIAPGRRRTRVCPARSSRSGRWGWDRTRRRGPARSKSSPWRTSPRRTIARSSSVTWRASSSSAPSSWWPVGNVDCVGPVTGRAEKVGPHTHYPNSFKYQPIIFSHSGKFLVKWILEIPSHLAYVATLPCETLMWRKTSR